MAWGSGVTSVLTGDEVKTDYDTNKPLPPDPKPVGLRRREMWQRFRAFLLAGAAHVHAMPAPPPPPRALLPSRAALVTPMGPPL